MSINEENDISDSDVPSRVHSFFWSLVKDGTLVVESTEIVNQEDNSVKMIVTARRRSE